MNDLLLQFFDLNFFGQETYLAASDSDEGGPVFWLAGPVGAVAFYSYIFLRYRNTDKRHQYEHKTATEMGQVATYDEKIGEVKGVKNRYMSGENSSSPLTRLGEKSVFTETWRRSGSE